MGTIYQRKADIVDKIKDVKLSMSAWKVLFALDGQTSNEKLSQILEIDDLVLDEASKELLENELIVPVAADTPVEAVEEEVMIQNLEQFEEEKAASTEESPEDLEIDLDGTDLEDLLSESSEVETEDELSMDSIPFEPKSQKEEGALDDLVSQIVEQDDEDQEEDIPADVDELENLLSMSESEVEETGEVTFKDEPEEIELEEDINEDELLADLEKDIQDFMVEDEEGENHFEVSDESQDSMVGEDIDLDQLENEFDFSEDTAVEPETAAPEVSAPVEAGTTEGQKTILIVDDSVVIRKMIEIALEEEPFNITAAPTGKEALAKIDEEEIDIIILDLMLPDLNGLDILKAVKASSETPVIILTGKDAPKELQTAKELGADEFLTKPFKDEELVQKVKTLTA